MVNYKKIPVFLNFVQRLVIWICFRPKLRIYSVA
jgi:hypothetical protein